MDKLFIYVNNGVIKSSIEENILNKETIEHRNKIAQEAFFMNDIDLKDI